MTVRKPSDKCAVPGHGRFITESIGGLYVVICLRDAATVGEEVRVCVVLSQRRGCQ